MISTLRLFSLNRFPIEASTVWYLNDLGEYRGKRELYTRQSPQRLKALREQQEQGFIGCSGRGVGALWSRVDSSNEGNPLPPNKGNEGGNKQ